MYIQDSYAAFLEEFGVSTVPTEFLTQLPTPLSVCHCNSHDATHWRVSHVSSESFFKNKHGKVQNNANTSNNQRLGSVFDALDLRLSPLPS